MEQEGHINSTNLKGGFVQRMGEKEWIPFYWKDTTLRPGDVGTGTPVSFNVEIERGRARAFALKRRPA